MRATLRLSERRVCRVLGQHRSTQRIVPRGRDDEERLTADIVELARRYGRYGYRKIAALLHVPDSAYIAAKMRAKEASGIA